MEQTNKFNVNEVVFVRNGDGTSTKGEIIQVRIDLFKKFTVISYLLDNSDGFIPENCIYK